MLEGTNKKQSFRHTLKQHSRQRNVYPKVIPDNVNNVIPHDFIARQQSKHTLKVYP